MRAVALARLKVSRMISVAVTYCYRALNKRLQVQDWDTRGLRSRVTLGSLHLPMYGDLGYKLVSMSLS